MNTKVIAILVSAIAVGAIVLATGALSTPPTSPSTPAKAPTYTENINSTYNVTDPGGNVYGFANWSGPSIPPNSATTTTFSIGSSCAQCTLHGSAFTFTSGYQYTIKVVTGRGNIFTFAVTQPSGHHYSVVLQVGFGSVAQ